MKKGCKTGNGSVLSLKVSSFNLKHQGDVTVPFTFVVSLSLRSPGSSLG